MGSVYTKCEAEIICGRRAGKAGAKKEGMVAHPRVLTQRTPVLRNSGALSFLRAAFFGALRCRFGSGLGRFLSAAFLCSCHKLCFSFREFLRRTQDTVAGLLLCTTVKDIQHIVVYICLSNSCQRFFLPRGAIKAQNTPRIVKAALAADFRRTVSPHWPCSFFGESRRNARASAACRYLFEG